MTSRTSNVAIGRYALYGVTSEGYNTAVGNKALWNAPGSFNTALSYEAGKNSSGIQNVFLGYRAGMNSTGDYKLYVGSRDADGDLRNLLYGIFHPEISHLGKLQVQLLF